MAKASGGTRARKGKAWFIAKTALRRKTREQNTNFTYEHQETN